MEKPQPKPLGDLADVANGPLIKDFGLLLKAASRLNRRMDATLREECGISHTAFEVLICLCRQPDGRISQRELADHLTLTSGGITRLIDRMEQAGLVRRLPSPADRRTTLVEPTEHGAAGFLRAVQVHSRVVEQHFLAPVNAVDRPHLIAALGAIVAATKE
jgi:DNA-binding MarR family transcriptional regulator